MVEPKWEELQQLAKKQKKSTNTKHRAHGTLGELFRIEKQRIQLYWSNKVEITLKLKTAEIATLKIHFIN